MTNEIPEIPDVPDEIVEAINNDKLAVFIGAGVSRLVGCDGWDQLAKSLVECCFNHKIINYREKETICQFTDHKKIISICYELLKEKGFEENFFEQLKYALKDNEEVSTPNIYNDIKRIRGLFITTNVDRHFDKLFPNDKISIVHKETDFRSDNIDRTKLYHIHGSIADPDSLVFTVQQYFKRYKHTPNFIEFLKRIFDKYIVLFIGYGLAEFELLDFLFEKFDSKKEIEIKHFILLPFYQDEVNIFYYEQLYYNQMGITVKPYRKDIKGYEQLCEVIKEWSSRINQVSTYLYDSFIEIDKAIENPADDNIASVLRTINNEKPLENYLFRKLTSSKNLTPWLIPLKESGYMNPSKNPSPENVPGTLSYIILYYLEKLAKTNSENPSNAVTKELCNFIDSVIDYRDKDGNRKDDLYIYWSIEILSYLPIQYIQQKHVDFIRIALETRWDNALIATAIGESYIPNLIRSKAKELFLNSLNVVMDYKKENGNYIPLMDEYRFSNMIKMNKEQIAKLCGIEATEIALEKIKTIIKENESEFGILKIRTIESNSQKELQRSYSGILVYFVRDMYELSDANQIRPKVDELLKMGHPIFKRLAIHIINHHYDKLSDLFWNLAYNPLDDGLVKHETYELLRKRCILFDEQQTDRIIDWIESKNYSRFDEIKYENEKERVIAYRKREWLSALLESKNPKVVERYEEYTKINDKELDHPGHLFWTELSWGDVSPIKANELIDMSNSQISDYLNNFKEEKFSLKSPTKDGLSDELHGGATINPDKFSSDMEPFKSINLEYQNAILSGLCRAWGQGKFFNWSELLDFSLEIIQIEEFWNWIKPKAGWDYKNWIISTIAELINEGTKKDDHAMDENLLPKAEEILLILVNNTKSGIEKEEDVIEATMNTPKGKIFEAMMNYSLHFARINKKPKGERWVTSIKEEFNKRLDRSFDESLEFFVILGQFLPNLFYLDDSWLKDNIDRIFPKDNDEYWHVAFTGYLLSTRSVYKEIYLLLKNKGHYSKAITTQFNAKLVGKYAMEQCVQHICVVYLENLENLDDNESLINQLLHNINPEQLSELINYISGIQDDLKAKSKEKFKPLWKRMIEILSPHQNEPVYQKVLSETSKFLSLVERIDDETFEWLKLSVKCFPDVYNLDYFIEVLKTHVKKTPNYVGEIYIELLKSEKYPDYPEEKIQDIVETIYQKGERELADRICNMYFMKGSYTLLKEIYEKHRENDIKGSEN